MIISYLYPNPRDRSSDAGINLTIAEKSGTHIEDAPTADELRRVLAGWPDATLLIDSLFGTGLQGELDAPIKGLIEAINGAGLPVVSADIPSGLDCDTGEPLGAAVRAVRTSTNQAYKTGFDNPASRQYTGPVELASLGCPEGAWGHCV